MATWAIPKARTQWKPGCEVRSLPLEVHSRPPGKSLRPLRWRRRSLRLPPHRGVTRSALWRWTCFSCSYTDTRPSDSRVVDLDRVTVSRMGGTSWTGRGRNRRNGAQNGVRRVAGTANSLLFMYL